jgi:hypothetical protein
MSNALDEFRAQMAAVEQAHARLTEFSELLHKIRSQMETVAHDQAFRELMRAEESWLSQARHAVSDVRAFREQETRRFWPAMWRRWAVATAFALASAFAFGSGYVWASRPDQTELASLRSRVELMDFVAKRVITMTPTERREFDLLMKWNTTSGR